MKSKQEIIESRDHAEFLKNEDLWPSWPVCPVKRYHGGTTWDHLQCGLVFCSDPKVVVMLNLFALSGMDKEQFDAAERYKYETVDELVADGWEVD